MTVSLWQGEKLPLCIGAYAVQGRMGGPDFAVPGKSSFVLKWHAPGKEAAARKIAFSRKLLDEGLEIVLGE